jgi:hypothetical protein
LKAVAVQTDQVFEVFLSVERTVLRQIDDAVEPPDSSAGFAVWFRDQVGASPDTLRD